MNRPKHPCIDESTIAEVGEILRSGLLTGFTATPAGYLGGPYVRRLEQAFKDKFGCKHAIAVNSATAGLHASLLACGIGTGDEVITTPYTFSASASCILMVGATPVFADVEDDTFNIDPINVLKAITSKTKAIIPVHLCGHPADMSTLMDISQSFEIPIIEDAAQAIGANYHGEYVGTMGDTGVFSFNQSKHISTGEGGMVITNSDELAERLRAIRNHGEVSNPNMRLLGYNYRMSEIEACLALRQLESLDERTKWRQKLAEAMTKGLKDIPGLTPPVGRQGCSHVWYTYGIKVSDKRGICQRLKEKGVYFGEYITPLHLLPLYGGHEGDCPVAERLWREQLIVTDILRYPTTLTDVDDIIEVFKQIMEPVPCR